MKLTSCGMLEAWGKRRKGKNLKKTLRESNLDVLLLQERNSYGQMRVRNGAGLIGNPNPNLRLSHRRPLPAGPLQLTAFPILSLSLQPTSFPRPPSALYPFSLSARRCRRVTTFWCCDRVSFSFTGNFWGSVLSLTRYSLFLPLGWLACFSRGLIFSSVFSVVGFLLLFILLEGGGFGFFFSRIYEASIMSPKSKDDNPLASWTMAARRKPKGKGFSYSGDGGYEGMFSSSTSVYVDILPNSMDEEWLYQLFSPHGELILL
ncbi:hypothetical protein RHSIM_Rhsim04G0183100 [Rhododendron simsii]|uniref:RRM domain-containing protein n=1 Tax=Rhododendron simsii TaxID=118357 RepID=A0A834GZ87_RHOSS|nr:hypothetical protein RHSIM_Rhsim04G0183100 [Rhododendron simsii]